MKFNESRDEVNAIHVRSFTNSSHNKTNKCAEIKIIFFYIQFFHNSDMFRLFLINLRELLNIIKAYTNTYVGPSGRAV